MKKIVYFFLCFLLLFSLSGCSDGSSQPKAVDYDITALSNTVAYSQVYDMLAHPENYVGKTVKIKGRYYSEYVESTKTNYNYIMLSDETACCSQGLEFLLDESLKFPDDYPDADSDITLEGTFGYYVENSSTYYCLKCTDFSYTE